MGVYNEYPSEIKDYYANLTGTIDGEEITMNFVAGSSTTYQIVFSLDK